MLIKTITFEIHNFQTHISELFVVENTPEMQEKILTHRYTRNIQFDQMQDFQFRREMRIPSEFIDMNIWIRLLSEKPYLFEMALAA